MRYMLLVFLITGTGMGKWAVAPDYRALDRIEGAYSGGGNKITPCDTIGSIPDMRAALGTPGKNIAVRGDTVVVIYGPPSNDPDNIFLGVRAAYSFDGGHTYSYFDLSTTQVRRIYPGVIWPENWDSPLFFWQEARYESGVYLPSKIFIAYDLAFPNGVFTVEELPNSEDWDVWLPSADASGDTIIVFAVNVMSSFLTFYWRTYDMGETWVSDTFPGGWIDTPIPRIGHDGYIALITDRVVDYGWEALTPFFLESLDGGQTWIDTINLWEACGWTPYDSAGGWWYVYDFVLDTSDRPHISWKFGAGSLEYGDCWYIGPAEGSPGAWEGWEMKLIAGEGDGTPVATQPTITYDPENDMLFYTLKAFYIVGTDTLPHIGLFYTGDLGEHWMEIGPWGDPDEVEESAFELPVISGGGWSSGLHASFADDYFCHAGPYYVGIGEGEENTGAELFDLFLSPGGRLVLSLDLENTSYVGIKLYDSAGRLAEDLYRGPLEKGYHELEFDIRGRKSGVYFVRAEVDGKSSSRKLILVR